MARKPPSRDWDRHAVLAALRRAGLTLSSLARAHGLHYTTLRAALGKGGPRAEALIAEALGQRPEEIWPSRYTPEALAENPWRRYALAQLGHPVASAAPDSSEPRTKHKAGFPVPHSSPMDAERNRSEQMAA